ncbi:MAG: hypothetical protein V7607_2649 [Solirubrobacteraceae bacterium]
MFRHLSLREFVGLVSTELGIPAEELQEDEFLRTAKRALDEPASRNRGRHGERGRERYRTLPTKFAALVGALLGDPPIPGHAGRVALAAGEELLRRGRGRWREDRTRTILRFDEWARNPLALDPKRLARGVGPAGGRRTPPARAETLFDPHRELTIGVYLGGPLQALRANGQSDVVGDLHERCAQEFTQLSAELGGQVRFRLFHPSWDTPLREPYDLWEWDLGLLEDGTDLLVVADIGRYAISFGVACEIHQFRQLPGETLHVRARECDSRSAYVDGLTGEVAMASISNGHWHGVAAAARAWIKPRIALLLDASRRRDDAVFLVESQHRRLARRWEQLPAARRSVIRDAADISAQRMSRVLERPASFAALPAFSLDRLRDLVLDDSARPTEVVDVDALLDTATRDGWSASEVAAVLAEARRRVQSLRAAATRPSDDGRYFQALHDELYGS